MANRFDARTLAGAFGDYVSGNTEVGDTIYYVLEYTAGKPRLVVFSESRSFGKREEDLTPLIPESPRWKVDPSLGHESDYKGFEDWPSFMQSLLREFEGIATTAGRYFKEAPKQGGE